MVVKYGGGKLRSWDGGDYENPLSIINYVLESAPSALWFQQVWAVLACGQQTVNLSQPVGVSVSAEKL